VVEKVRITRQRILARASLFAACRWSSKADFGPVVALGNPHDRFPPYGAARGYFDNKDWQQAVTNLARDANSLPSSSEAKRSASAWRQGERSPPARRSRGT